MAFGKKKNSEAAPQGEHEKKKKPVLLVLLIVLGAIVCIGTFIKVKSASAKSRPAAAKPIERGPTMALDEFLVNLADPGSDHFLKVSIALELNKASGKTPETMKEDIPCIRDAVLSSLTSETRADICDNPGKEKLKDEIRASINQAMGASVVKNVYFVDFVTQ
jgi:flagellar basal body-associated protein FliL